MAELKLTIDQLKNYLGTGLKILDGWGDVRNLKYTHLDDEGNHGQIFNVKPICLRLSDLDKFIPELGFVPAKELAKLITQAGYQAEKIQNIKNEDDTITCVWPIKTIPYIGESESVAYQNFFEIDIESDFGFGIYYKKILKNGTVVEIESNTGNIWAMTQKLFQWHFWPFGNEYFEAGLVIDKMKVGKEDSHV